MKKLLPVLLALMGTGAGVGAGLFLAPPVEDPATADAEMTGEEQQETATATANAADDAAPDASEYVRMNNQFLVPIIATDQVNALVVMSLSLEVKTGATEAVYQREPKLRDDFLQVMFDHANIGGFDGAFTETRRMAGLRQALLDVAQRVLGDTVTDVLITEIARQEV